MGGAGGGGGRGSRRPAVNAGEWKGQRGMQRNRMAEKSDPDFVRNYDNYRPSFAPYRQLADPGGGGGGGGRGGRGGGRDGPGGQQPQPSPRLLQQHPVRVVVCCACLASRCLRVLFHEGQDCVGCWRTFSAKSEGYGRRPLSWCEGGNLGGTEDSSFALRRIIFLCVFRIFRILPSTPCRSELRST